VFSFAIQLRFLGSGLQIERQFKERFRKLRRASNRRGQNKKARQGLWDLGYI